MKNKRYTNCFDLLGVQENEMENDQPKQAVSPAEIAQALIEGIRTWPVKHGDFIRQDYHGIIKKEIDDVFDEIRYFLCFSLDFGLHCTLKDKPQLQSALRDAFNVQLRNFVSQHGCKPIPDGEWLGDKRIWMTSGKTPTETGRPLTNLDRRFGLYVEVLKRGKDKSAGESLAYILAALCGTTDIGFIVWASEIFLGQIKAIENILDSFEITF